MSLARSRVRRRRRSCGYHIPAPRGAHALDLRSRPSDRVLWRREEDHRVALLVEPDLVQEELERKDALRERDRRVVGL